MKGNSSSVSVHGRRSETYARGQDPGSMESAPRPSTSSPYYGSLPAPRMTSASRGNAYTEHPFTDGSTDHGGAWNHQQNPHANGSTDYADGRKHQQRKHAPSNDAPIQDFSILNLHSSSPRHDQEDYPRRQHQGPESYASNARETGYSSPGHGRHPHVEDSSAGVQMVGRTHPTQPNEYVPGQSTSPVGRDQERHGYRDQNYGLSGTRPSDYPTANGAEDVSAMRRTPSVARKEVPSFSHNSGAAHQQVTSSPNLTNPTRHRANFTSAPRYQYEGDHRSRPQEAAQQDSSGHIASPRHTQNVRPSAHEVVDRARGNTYDTEVVEKIAPGKSDFLEVRCHCVIAEYCNPAVVHERVHQNVHHIRKELITREIHEHEVYHRILPVIDVEVLPPRHFLPVEGGGLVEISGKEVPGRGNNWVIAETASKIPSDQAAPKGLRDFSARQFHEGEGDAVEYTTAEGYPRTEQTWVHPPELETGGRNTGQTWPMEFGNETMIKADREHKSSRAPKSKRSRKSMEAQPSMNQQPRTGSYT